MNAPFRRTRSVRTTLFSSYLLLIAISIAFFTVFSYLYSASTLKNQAINSLRDLAVKAVDALDAELAKMNGVSVSITSSGLIKEMIRRQAELTSSSDRYLNSQRAVKVIQTIIGPYKPVPQVNYYDLHGWMIGAGVYSQAAALTTSAAPWLDRIDLESGSKQYSLPHSDQLLENTFPLYRNRSYISLYRTFFDEYRSPLGVIEVKQFTDTIFRSMFAESGKVLVYNSAGARLFPVEGVADSAAPAALGRAAGAQILILQRPPGGRRELAVVAASEQSDWRVVVTQEERLLLRPVRRFTTFILLFGLLLAVAATLIASRLAARLTVPLRGMHDALSGLDWNMVSTGPSSRVPADLNELEELELAFHNMQRKLRESMDEALQARAHELRATMLALQSQMDPHFVYNMLTTIGIMAEEGMSGEIAASVEHLTHLLRYLSSGRSSVVSIAEELEYAERYLACMKIRFRESLSYRIEVPEAIRRVQVPKLIIQPIIENAMKYGTSTQPPWQVTIGGEAAAGGWSISVRDNGPGFPADKLTQLEAQIAAHPVPAPDLAISGLGLLNIAARLRLYYGGEAVYRLGNDPAGGARVVIGGSYEQKAQVFGAPG